MKIYTIKILENGICVTSVATSDFSCTDIQRMEDFEEPQINTGGLFRAGTQGVETGSVDLSAGYDFQAAPKAFGVAVNGLAPATVPLIAACADLAAVVLHINTGLAALALDLLVEAVESGTHVRLQTVAGGASQSMVLSAGVPDDALAVLGMAAGTYSGTGPDDFTLPNDLARVKSDSPFVGRFDSRDLGVELAAERGDIYGDKLTARIKAAMDELRLLTDDFTDETMITY
jgi:hypothetical protein